MAGPRPNPPGGSTCRRTPTLRWSFEVARARSVATQRRETSTSASGPDGARWETTSMATRPAARPGPRSSSSSHGLLPSDALALRPLQEVDGGQVQQIEPPVAHAKAGDGGFEIHS